jgi:hypothetical protein
MSSNLILRLPRSIAQTSVIGTLFLLPVFSCSLLEPYPNDENPVDQLLDPSKGASGISNGEIREPLVNPPQDPTVTVANKLSGTVESTLPGGSFKVQLAFIAPGKNVVGGGIQLEDSDEVQWTFLQGLQGNETGEVAFSFSVGTNVCDDVPPLCHGIKTRQFAVSVDPFGVYSVSPPVEATIVLQCASCESESCTDLLKELGDESACRACEQPKECADLYTSCYAPGAVAEGTTEADVYQAFFSERGVMWTGLQTCASGTGVCQSILSNACKLPKTSYFSTDSEEMQ